MLTRDENILIGRLLVICTDVNRGLLERFTEAYEVIPKASREFCFELREAAERERQASWSLSEEGARLATIHLWNLDAIDRVTTLRLQAIAYEERTC